MRGGRFRSLLSVMVGLALAGAAVARNAGEDAQRALDRVDVTGTRIKQAMVEGASPLRSLTRSDIQRSGLHSIGDILQQLTSSGSALNTRFNSSGNFGFPADSGGIGAGATTVDLRHLGCKRVLVLVDGVRWVSESSASGVSSCSDLNTIPLAVVERIDVLGEGASSVYGSDAIAGVINIITRRDFEGATAGLYAAGSGHGDGQTYAGEASYGVQRGALNLFVSLSSVDQHGVSSSDREISRYPAPGTGLALGSPATPQGHFIIRDPQTGEVRDLTTPEGSRFAGGMLAPGAFVPFTLDDSYNYAGANLALTPSQRDGLFAQARFAFSDDVNGYLRTLVNRRQSLNRAAPEPIFLGALAGTGNPLADEITIAADNPYNPFGIDLVSTGPDANLLLAARRPVEGGLRRFSQEVDTYHLAFGLEGVFEAVNGPFYWDVNIAESRNRAEQTNLGSYNLRNIATALGPLGACQATPGCVPLDIFGGVGSITPEMLDFIQPSIHDRSGNDLRVYSANLTGDLFELWAGPLAIAAGVEHRAVEGFYDPDPITVAGDYNGVPSLPTRGHYSVDELYFEADVPAYLTAASQLDLTAALRWSDYSTSGGELTTRFGFRWQFGDSLLLRGTAAEGFRAPSIGELFGSAARFDAYLRDPCLIGADGSPATIDCAAFDVPRDAVQSNGQIPVTTGGNEALQPEHSNSQSLGLVWSPGFANARRWSQRLDVELNWYHHRIEGAIQAVNPQTQLDLCAVEGPDSPFCRDISRGPLGGITAFVNRLQNFGRIVTEGADVNLAWDLPTAGASQWRLRWNNSLVFNYALFDGRGQRQPRAEGVESDDAGIPEWTSVLDADWVRGDLELGWTLRHFSALDESCGRVTLSSECDDPVLSHNRLAATTYHDLRVRWKTPWWDELQLSGGVANVFNRQPPVCLSCSLNGYDASTYDLPGRLFWMRAELGF